MVKVEVERSRKIEREIKREKEREREMEAPRQATYDKMNRGEKGGGENRSWNRKSS